MKFDNWILCTAMACASAAAVSGCDPPGRPRVLTDQRPAPGPASRTPVQPPDRTQIREYETRIAALKRNMHRSSQHLDQLYGCDLELLEARNQALKARLDTSPRFTGDRKRFMRAFNQELEELSLSLKVMALDNQR